MRGGFNRNLFLLMEIYKKIPGIPNYYEASSLGNIRVLDHYVKGRWGYALIKGKILKQTTCKKGYKTVTLEKSKVYKLVTRWPNWNHRDLKLGEIGYLTYNDVESGRTEWYNPNTKTMELYRTTACEFISFIAEKKTDEQEYIM